MFAGSKDGLPAAAQIKVFRGQNRAEDKSFKDAVRDALHPANPPRLLLELEKCAVTGDPAHRAAKRVAN